MKEPILIPIYNFKGGIGKTTATYNIAYVLSKMGLRVLMVDADPQCNLTGLIFAEQFVNAENSTAFYAEAEQAATNTPPRLKTMREVYGNILHEQQPRDFSIAAQVELAQVHNYENLFLIPGHIKISGLDAPISLGLARVALYKNIPGYITNLLRQIGRIQDIDVILIDCSPSFSALNSAIIIGSDYFLIPFSADFFSLQAIQSLKEKIPEWNHDLHEHDARLDPIGRITTHPKCLGAFPQKIRVRGSKVEQAYATWINQIYRETDHLFDTLEKEQLVIPNFQAHKVEGVIDFVSIGLDAQSSGRPVCDINYSHRHTVNPGKSISITREARNKKIDALAAYKKIIGRFFQNLSIEHKHTLTIANPEFNQLLALYGDLRAAINIVPYLELPTPPETPMQDRTSYSKDNIDQLMQHYCANQAVLYCSAISFTPPNLHSELIKIQPQILDGTTPLKALIPIDLGELQWAILYIRRSQDDRSTPTVYYFSPLGHNNDERVKEAVRSFYQNHGIDVEPYSMEERCQDEEYNSGPWIIAAAQCFIENRPLPRVEYDITTIRSTHNKLLETNTRLLRPRTASSSVGAHETSTGRKRASSQSSAAALGNLGAFSSSSSSSSAPQASSQGLPRRSSLSRTASTDLSATSSSSTSTRGPGSSS